MSGFEAAGLVLGALPLVIQGLKTVNETRRVFRTKNALINELIQVLMFYEFSINEQVRKVLRGAGVDYAEIALPHHGKAAEQLHDPLKNDAIVRYLGLEKFNLFVHQLRLCQEALSDIVNLFEGLIAKPKIYAADFKDDVLRRLIFANEFSDRFFFQGTGRKLKFTYRKEDIDAKTLKLARAAERLKDRDLQAPQTFAYADSVAGEIGSRALQSLTKSFDVVQLHAARLYLALIRTLPKSCHQCHSIRLFLDERTGPLQRRRVKNQKFRVELLAYSSPDTIDTWHICDIPMQGEAEDDVETQQRTSVLRFALTSAEPTLEQVKAFCLCLQEVKAKQRSLSLHLTSHKGLCYTECAQTFLTQQARRHWPSTAETSITLEKVIERATDPTKPEANWSWKQRMILALRLGCSLLQLNRTHWLATRYTSSSIYFQRIGNGNMKMVPGAAPPFEADQPFVARFDPPGFDADEPESLAHPLVLDLSIVLMEIWSKTTFGRRCVQRCLQNLSTYHERRQGADEWLSELDPDMAPHYKRAVKRCVEIASRTSYSFENDEFRADFCEGVVKPLWENCREWLA